LSLDQLIPVYIPHPESLLCTTIAKGSGIVGQPMGSDGVTIYYEGNLYGSASLRRYAERVLQAAARMRARYPTKGTSLVDPRELIQVGVYDPIAKRVTLSERPEAITFWVDLSDPQELQA
jgi:hypothetical protein